MMEISQSDVTKPGGLRKAVLAALDYFAAGVPPYGYLDIEVSGLKKLIKNSRSESGINQTVDVCLIALSAYFEAFCKTQFAAIINICPYVLETFASNRKDASLNLRNVLEVLGQIESKLGHVVSEGHDFGSARAINTLYRDLLGITPFSAKEQKQYDQFLSDRNLLVHHAGVYTFGYVAQRFRAKPARGLPHWGSLVTSKKDHDRWADFLMRVAHKISLNSQSALGDFVKVKQIKLNESQVRAVSLLAP
jgi:hypothetical protein